MDSFLDQTEDDLPDLVFFFRVPDAVPILNDIRCYSTPLLGAYIADTYWGRFKTAGFALFVALIGHVILIISAVLFTVDKYGASLAFVVALIITGLGTGLFNANIYPLVAEQSNRKKLFVIIMNGGERVIVDPALTVSRVYMVSRLSVSHDGHPIDGTLVSLLVHHSWRPPWSCHDCPLHEGECCSIHTIGRPLNLL